MVSRLLFFFLKGVGKGLSNVCLSGTAAELNLLPKHYYGFGKKRDLNPRSSVQILKAKPSRFDVAIGPWWPGLLFSGYVSFFFT